jgi:hypothetical protein
MFCVIAKTDFYLPHRLNVVVKGAFPTTVSASFTDAFARDKRTFGDDKRRYAIIDDGRVDHVFYGDGRRPTRHNAKSSNIWQDSLQSSIFFRIFD